MSLYRKYQEDKNHVHKIIAEYRIKRVRLLKRLNEIYHTPLENLSDNKIWELFEETRKIAGYTGSRDWLGFAVDNMILEAVGLDKLVGNNKEMLDARLRVEK